jgi:hypothetical protein
MNFQTSSGIAHGFAGPLRCSTHTDLPVCAHVCAWLELVQITAGEEPNRTKTSAQAASDTTGALDHTSE